MNKWKQAFSSGDEEVNLQSQDVTKDELKHAFTESNTQHIKKLLIQKIKAFTAKSMMQFSKANWNNIIELRLFNNSIRAQGCKYLTRASMPHLQFLRLGVNGIGSEGVLHLSKGQWKNLIHLELGKNEFGPNSMRRLVSGDWNNLGELTIVYNRLFARELTVLVLAYFELSMLKYKQQFSPMEYRQTDDQRRYFKSIFSDKLGKQLA